jgi:hypothetical protein
MNVINTGIGGLAGSAAMMLFILGSPRLVGLPPIDIAAFLGSVFTPRKWAARILGAGVLLAIGIEFALLCQLLWRSGIGDTSLRWGLIFGGAQGVLALVLLALLMPRHPRPWQWRSVSQDSLGIFLWLGHLVFGLAVVAVL